MGRLIVVSGPPGAGKSTLAELLADTFDPSAVLAADAVFGALRRGAVEPWRPEAHAQNTEVLEAAAAAAGRLTAGGRTVVYDGVLGPWFLPGFVAATGLVEIEFVVLLPGEARVERQVRERTGHAFRDLDAARELHRQFAAAPLDARHVVTDPPHDPAGTAALVRHRLTAGTLRWAAPGGG